jgi:hypothetical protein
MDHGGLMASVVLNEPSLGLSPVLVPEIFRSPMPRWVKNGCGGRSTGTSAVPRFADDFGARASRQRWASYRLLHRNKRTLGSPFIITRTCRLAYRAYWQLNANQLSSGAP